MSISYSLSSSDRVLELAERLMANGVNVILDKWDLREGYDKYAFMEQSVNNPDVDKVLIICDKTYAKADIPPDEAILKQIDEEKILRDLFIDYLEAIIYSDLPVDSIVPTFFEQAYNATHNANGRGSYSNHTLHTGKEK